MLREFRRAISADRGCCHEPGEGRAGDGVVVDWGVEKGVVREE